MAVSALEFIEENLSVRTKDARLVPFKLNAAQLRLYRALEDQRRAGKPMRAIVLKARQLGFSTLAEALIFERTATRPNVNSLIVAHREDAAASLFNMSKLFYETMPEEKRPKCRVANSHQMLFDSPERDPARKSRDPGLNSRIRCASTGGAGVGRGDTFHNVHASEFAYWVGDKNQSWTAIMQAVPSTPDTLVIVESTANGYEQFHAMWEAAVAGESDFVPLFFPWFENPEYRREPEPDAVWTPQERDLQARYGLDAQQLAWRRWCIRNNCAGDERVFRQEYPSCPEEAFVTSGQCVFDAELLARRRSQTVRPIMQGRFDYDPAPDGISLCRPRFREEERGIVRIWKEPQPRRPYVIGGDTAGAGSDYFTAQVLDNTTGEQVAVLRHRYDEDQYARQLYCLGRYYNDALIAVETNYSTYPVKLLDMMGYPRLYVREAVDTFTGAVRASYGFETTSRTRPVIIAQLVAAFREHPELFSDPLTLGEMLVFQYNESRRPEAMPGEHDDLVMALAIAWGVRGQQSYLDAPDPLRRAAWTQDMIDDYRRASPENRAVLERMWGVPWA
ncbi:MAG: hypothetical protein LUH42_06005 [Oscillospiraceae bacterium]|nr:hypothetical protein [Oscillospiraceae bacterium]